MTNYNAGGKQDQLLLGIFFMVLGETLIVLSGAIVKHLADEVPVSQIVFFRNFFGFVMLLPIVLRIGVLRTGLVRLKTEKLPIHFQRAAFGVCAMSCLFYSFQTLKLTEAVLLKATSPIMLTFIAWIVLRERLSWVGWSAVFLAFTGVIIIVNPVRFEPIIGLGFLAGVSSALLAALAKMTVRRLGRTEPSDVIVFYFMFFGSLLALPIAIWNWQWVSLIEWGWLALIAIVSTLGQLGVTKAFSVVKTGKVAIFTYLSLPIAGLLGWFLWQEEMTAPLILGTTVIIVAGFLSALNTSKS